MAFASKILIYLSILILLVLGVASFYGLNTDRFYLLKTTNFIFPILSIVHFIYLYAFWFKLSEQERPDPKMRNLEYVLYGILLFYGFKLYQTLNIVSNYGDTTEYSIPTNFLVIGYGIISLYGALIVLTLLLFWCRKLFIGSYDFENFNDKANMWR